MTDDLTDIDPEVIAAVTKHASVFVDADKQVDEIVLWGEREVAMLETHVQEGKMNIEDFKKRAESIQSEVERRLHELKEEIAARHTQSGTE